MKFLQSCVSWLDQKVLAVAGAAVLGLIVCGVGPGLLAAVGITPLLLILACLLPCLIPLAYLRERWWGKANTPQAPVIEPPAERQQVQP